MIVVQMQIGQLAILNALILMLMMIVVMITLVLLHAQGKGLLIVGMGLVQKMKVFVLNKHV